MKKTDSELINKALDYAIEAHKYQVDDNGDLFIYHPSIVAELVWSITADEVTTAAALLHDTIEDTETTYNDLLKEFGKEVADLVNEVTHEGKKDSKGYYFPRLKTQKGIIIKFADRLHNLTRMQSWDKKRVEQYLRKSKFWASE